MRLCFYFVSFLLLAHVTEELKAQEIESCVYRNEQGVDRKVRSLRQVPSHLRATARCLVRPSQNRVQLAAPDKIDLEGNLRRERIMSSLGPINIRWPRAAEEVLGRTPMRAMADAAKMADKALKQEGFPARFRNFDLNWEVVFMDENVPETQVPMQLVSNCHPAWMTPPSNIYVVVQRVAAGCGGQAAPSSSEVDAKLAEVLAHEIGHVVESQLLGLRAFQAERWRAEGFATFFERRAAEYSRIIPKGSVAAEHYRLARSGWSGAPIEKSFNGSAAHYAKASMYVEAVAAAKGVKGLLSIYEDMSSTGSTFIPTVLEKTNWSRNLLDVKARAFID